MKKVFWAVLLFALPSGAVTKSGLEKKLKFKSGVYKLQKGSSKSCVGGRFEIFNAHGNVFHLEAAGRIFANNIHTKGVQFKDKVCKRTYRTKSLKKGFVNTERIECSKPRTFYSRTLKFERKNSKVWDYVLSTRKSKTSKKKSLRCRLRLMKRIK